jgi:GNAT superfamily N-acetyltransferase
LGAREEAGKALCCQQARDREREIGRAKVTHAHRMGRGGRAEHAMTGASDVRPQYRRRGVHRRQERAARAEAREAKCARAVS